MDKHIFGSERMVDTSMTRDEIYQHFGPMLVEALCDIIMDELNAVRAEHGLPPRTKQQLMNALEIKLGALEKYDWMDSP